MSTLFHWKDEKVGQIQTSYYRNHSAAHAECSTNQKEITPLKNTAVFSSVVACYCIVSQNARYGDLNSTPYLPSKEHFLKQGLIHNAFLTGLLGDCGVELKIKYWRFLLAKRIREGCMKRVALQQDFEYRERTFQMGKQWHEQRQSRVEQVPL